MVNWTSSRLGKVINALPADMRGPIYQILGCFSGFVFNA